MGDRKKRILWLFNHTSLRDVQVPLLIDLGYEVFCPKICSHDFGEFSTSVSYEFDQSLTLSDGEINALNQIDFYAPLSDHTFKMLNSYFRIVICIAVPEIIEQFLARYRGTIIVQGFGLAAGLSYTELLSYAYKGDAVLGNLQRMKRKDAFWLALSYNNLVEIESPLLQERSVYLPIGLKKAVPQHKWEGGDERILFVSPKIKVSSYYNNIYKEFCKNFGDIPHVIGGAQPQPVDEDETVTGFLPDEEYVYNMTHLAAMFYHSQEPRHLHYHPLEAVKWGMPLIFMAGGMLDELGGKDLPGRATTVREARNKLKRLMDGDTRFIKQVTESQEKLLYPFTDEYCRPFWEAGMKKIEASISIRRERRKKRIAVILPAAYTGGVYDYAIRFALAVQSQIEAHKAGAEIVFAHPKDTVYDTRDYFAALRRKNIQVREFTVEVREKSWMDAALQFAGFQPLKHNLPTPHEAVVLRDGMKDFLDCDYAFFMSDMAGSFPIFFFCPYTMVVHDYIQRYVPEAVSAGADIVKCYNQQHAMSIFVTSEPTRQDAIQHACLTPERVILTPPLLSFPESKKQTRATAGYFLWSTNAAPHKNHCLALEALEAYYQQGGRLDCVVTGVNTQYFQPDAELGAAPILKDYVAKIQEKIRQSESFDGHLVIKGNMPKKTYEECLAGACFVFHPGYGDNGNFTVTDAAALGVPSLASDYPAMRYLADYAGIPVKYMNPFEAEDMAKKLLEMEADYSGRAQMLPAAEALRKKNFLCNAEILYQRVREQVDFEEDISV